MPDDKDLLTVTLRVHDSQEKRDPKRFASWAVLKVPRSDFSLSKADFAAKWLIPSLDQIEHFKPR